MEKLVHKIREKICFSTCIDGDINRHCAHVCVICDCLIIVLEKVKYVKKDTLLHHSEKLTVSQYEEYYDGMPLNSELMHQYQVEDPDLKHLLLSPRARCHKEGYECCESCFYSLKSSKKYDGAKPSKCSIANGFAIGHIPEILYFCDSQGNRKARCIDSEHDLDDLICVAISPVRPFGYVHAYSAGSQKSIQRLFSLFSVDQSHVGGALHKYRSNTGGKNIYVVLCGRMTPSQKNIVRRQAEMNADCSWIY
jgi:hypothetical protein